MIIPEFIIFKGIIGSLGMLKEDLLSNSGDETKSILYDMFGKDENGDDVSLSDFNFFEQSKELLNGKRRKMLIALGYNFQTMETPTVHILLSNETNINSSFGANEGFEKDENGGLLINRETGEYTPVFNTLLQNNCSIILTSPSYFEIMIMYNILKYLFISAHDHYEIKGMQTIKISGADLPMEMEIAPNKIIFQRKIELNFSYEFRARSLNKILTYTGNEFSVTASSQ